MPKSFATPPLDLPLVVDDGDRVIFRAAIECCRETLARLVATDSTPVRVVRRIWYGKSLERPTYNIAGALFLRMLTETRPEIVIEGSADGNAWQPYQFRWKPGDLSRPPRFNTPHQPPPRLANVFRGAAAGTRSPTYGHH